MSRSYREPWWTDGFKSAGRRKKDKCFANKRIRNAVDVPNGKAYRKFYDPWNICDYRFPPIKPHVIWVRGEQELVVEDRPWRVFRK